MFSIMLKILVTLIAIVPWTLTIDMALWNVFLTTYAFENLQDHCISLQRIPKIILIENVQIVCTILYITVINLSSYKISVLLLR